MKILLKSLLLVLLIFSFQSNLDARSNPIMVIEFGSSDCDGEFNEEVARNNISTREINLFECDQNDECPPGYTPEFDDGCWCVPDCSQFEPCDGCIEVTWQVTEHNQTSEQVGFCGCDPDGFVFCGCPPWFTQSNDGFNEICDIPSDVDCYGGEIMIRQESVDCDNINNGLVTATVIIGLDEMGACISIAELENCELISGENFVVALAEQYDASAAFCAESNEDFIELIFEFDPEGPVPTWVTEIDGSFISTQLLSEEAINLCLRQIPTLSTWMIICLGLILAITGIMVVKRKEVASAFRALMLTF